MLWPQVLPPPLLLPPPPPLPLLDFFHHYARSSCSRWNVVVVDHHHHTATPMAPMATTVRVVRHDTPTPPIVLSSPRPPPPPTTSVVVATVKCFEDGSADEMEHHHSDGVQRSCEGSSDFGIGRFKKRLVDAARHGRSQLFSGSNTICGTRWRMVLYPWGVGGAPTTISTMVNKSGVGDDDIIEAIRATTTTTTMALFLDARPELRGRTDQWRVSARFTMRITNTVNTTATTARQDLNARVFNSRTPDWGFPDLLPLAAVLHERSGWLVDDTLTVGVTVTTTDVQ
mmetsp:Transcript_37798/g.92702  ORF Transcript_37798/g.92702 Transcript_37798/m.92702 type:complete len:285 (-) Transcript_37798:22-876(-)